MNFLFMHCTVVVVFIEKNKLLMDKRSSTKKVYPDFLMCPSGHLENGESLKDAINREMKEELGVQVRRSKYLFTLDDTDPFSRKHFRHNFMLIESYSGQIKSSKESDGLAWMSYPELRRLELAPIVMKLINRLHEKGMLS